MSDLVVFLYMFYINFLIVLDELEIEAGNYEFSGKRLSAVGKAGITLIESKNRKELGFEEQEIKSKAVTGALTVEDVVMPSEEEQTRKRKESVKGKNNENDNNNNNSIKFGIQKSKSDPMDETDNKEETPRKKKIFELISITTDDPTKPSNILSSAFERVQQTPQKFKQLRRQKREQAKIEVFIYYF